MSEAAITYVVLKYRKPRHFCLI